MGLVDILRTDEAAMHSESVYDFPEFQSLLFY
jgi:hypothetical protein